MFSRFLSSADAFKLIPKRRSTAALIGDPELLLNPHKREPLLAFDCVRIVNNSAGPDAELFTLCLVKKKCGGADGYELAAPSRNEDRLEIFEPSATSEPNEPLAIGPLKSHCKYFTVLGGFLPNN